MLVCTVIKLIATGRTARNGDNLFLPYKDNTQEAAGRIIDREALKGKTLVEEYIDKFSDPGKASGEKIVLMPS